MSQAITQSCTGKGVKEGETPLSCLSPCSPFSARRTYSDIDETDDWGMIRFLLFYIICLSTGKLRSEAARSPYKGTVAWDLQSGKHSPKKTVGMATSVPSSQASPALVNALFERVEEQAEVSTC